MNIPLTPAQQQSLDTQTAGPPRVIDPRTNAVYVLIPEADYETVREVLADEEQRRAIHAIALRNAAGRVNDIP